MSVMTTITVRGGRYLADALLGASARMKTQIEQELIHMANETTKKTPASAKKKVILTPKEKRAAKKAAKKRAKIDKKVDKLNKEISKRQSKIAGLLKKRNTIK